MNLEAVLDTKRRSRAWLLFSRGQSHTHTHTQRERDGELVIINNAYKRSGRGESRHKTSQNITSAKPPRRVSRISQDKSDRS